jgi:hypothetical protein
LVLNRISEKERMLPPRWRRLRAVPAPRSAMMRKASSGRHLALLPPRAAELGIPAGENVKATLDAHSVSFSGGTISLHDEEGVSLIPPPNRWSERNHTMLIEDNSLHRIRNQHKNPRFNQL